MSRFGVWPARVLAGMLLGASLALPSAALADVNQPELPTLPDPVAVQLDPATTAYLVLDINSAVCPPRPACMASVPVVQSLLAKARAANTLVVYSTTPNAQVLPDVAPQAGEPVVTSHADKFFDTDLDSILASRGIQTVVIVGAAANGAVLYTTFGAVERGYAAVIAEDGISSGQDFDTFLAEYQVLNMPGYANATNTPLKPKAATLSRSDLITYVVPGGK